MRGRLRFLGQGRPIHRRTTHFYPAAQTLCRVGRFEPVMVSQPQWRETRLTLSSTLSLGSLLNPEASEGVLAEPPNVRNGSKADSNLIFSSFPRKRESRFFLNSSFRTGHSSPGLLARSARSSTRDSSSSALSHGRWRLRWWAPARHRPGASGRSGRRISSPGPRGVPKPGQDVAGDTNVQRAAIAVGHDLDPAALHGSPFSSPSRKRGVTLLWHDSAGFMLAGFPLSRE